MSQTAEQIIQGALQLSPVERAAVIERLVSSLDSPNPRIQDLWLQEALDRRAAYQAGEMETYDADQVFAELETE